MTERATVLVVDDTPHNIDVLVDLLEGHYRTRVATSGEQALRIARAQPAPDIILLDIMMPGMDGHEVCRRLKADAATRDIPVVFVTARDEVQDEGAGFALGAVDYIAKPVSAPIVLARLRTHLRLRAQAVAIERQNEALRQAMRVREEVERIARHDLRTPLGSIAAIPALLRAQRRFEPAEEELLALVEGSAQRVLRMVNLTLDLHRMEEGNYSFTPEPVDLRAVARVVLRELEAHARSKAIKLSLEEGPPVFAEGQELLCHSIIANLAKNAVEAAPVGSAVWVSAEVGPSAALAIRNAGVVPAALRESFFEKYATHGKAGGTGLGTYSAHLAARAQRGDLTMGTSDVEGCTTLTLRLRAWKGSAPVPAAAPPALPVPPATIAPLQLLLVDDDPFNTLVLRRLLPSVLTVRTAVNGRAALDALRAQAADVVLMDLEMPVMGGMEAAGAMRALEAELGRPRSVIVGISGHQDEATRAACGRAGFDGYLSKPAVREEVPALLAALARGEGLAGHLRAGAP